MVNEYRFDNKEALYEALASAISQDLQASVSDEDSAAFLVSGGSSPAPVYRMLSSKQLRWSHIQVALVDERWVNPGEKGSNQSLIEHSLLQNQAVDAPFTGMKNDAATAVQGWADCEKGYRELPWHHAVALLGMGPDGHTASLFPSAEGLDNALHTADFCAPIMAKQSAVTGELTERMSLTLGALKQCKQLYLLITGEEKWQVYQQAKLAESKDRLVIANVLAAEEIQLNVYWAP